MSRDKWAFRFVRSLASGLVNSTCPGFQDRLLVADQGGFTSSFCLKAVSEILFVYLDEAVSLLTNDGTYHGQSLRDILVFHPSFFNLTEENIDEGLDLARGVVTFHVQQIKFDQELWDAETLVQRRIAPVPAEFDTTLTQREIVFVLSTARFFF
jgi:hypothetical protein